MRTQTEAVLTPAPGPTGPGEIRHAWLAAGLVLLGIGAALVAVLGPLVTGVIEYHVSERAVNQIIGGDVAGLLLVAPVSIFAGILVWQGHLAGPVLALGRSSSREPH